MPTDQTSLGDYIGNQLRRARIRAGMSLADVTTLSGGEFKASVIGAYERNERTPSSTRLGLLCALYGVSPAFMYPPRGKEQWLRAITAARVELVQRRLWPDGNDDDHTEIVGLVGLADEHLSQAAILCLETGNELAATA